MKKNSYQKNFSRSEIKYRITEEQKALLEQQLDEYIQPDKFYKSLICGMYIDTPNFLLTRRSMQKPVYKEKLRIRSYGVPTDDSLVFLEIKKKFKKITYKRRIDLPENVAMSYLKKEIKLENMSQISKEIDYFLNLYEDLAPRLFLSYERESFKGTKDKSFRLTFDKNILWRDYDLDLKKGAYGENLLSEGEYIMEVKCTNAIPLYFADFLNKNHIYKASFSKCARAYTAKMNKINLYENGGIRCA